jgi:hypothetical protein
LKQVIKDRVNDLEPYEGFINGQWDPVQIRQEVEDSYVVADRHHACTNVWVLIVKAFGKTKREVNSAWLRYLDTVAQSVNYNRLHLDILLVVGATIERSLTEDEESDAQTTYEVAKKLDHLHRNAECYEMWARDDFESKLEDFCSGSEAKKWERLMSDWFQAKKSREKEILRFKLGCLHQLRKALVAIWDKYQLHPTHITKSSPREDPINNGIQGKVHERIGDLIVDSPVLLCVQHDPKFECFWAVLIGINSYKLSTDLHACVSDVCGMRKLLLYLGVNNTRICSLTTKDETIKQCIMDTLWECLLAASHVDFANRGMLKGTCLAEMLYKFDEYYAAV